MNTIRPYRLKNGDRIAIWAPSFPVGGLYARRLARAVRALEDTGFQVQVDTTCLEPGSLTALPAKQLAERFHSLLEDTGIGAIVSAVGGWTTNCMLPHIDYALVRSSRKVICGYSDVAALLWAICAKARLVCFHGPAALSEWGEAGGVWSYTQKSFLNMVCARSSLGSQEPPPSWSDEFLAWDVDDVRRRESLGRSEWHILQGGRAEGILVGGCMATLALQLGTDYIPDLSGAILFLEEEESTPDKYYGHLVSLRQHGVFDSIGGLIVGRLSRPSAMRNGYRDFREPLDCALTGYDFPVLCDVDLGHTEPMLTLPIGARARLRCDLPDQGCIQVLDAVVE